jgi:hypothetical protein
VKGARAQRARTSFAIIDAMPPLADAADAAAAIVILFCHACFQRCCSMPPLDADAGCTAIIFAWLFIAAADAISILRWLMSFFTFFAMMFHRHIDVATMLSAAVLTRGVDAIFIFSPPFSMPGIFFAFA